MELDDWQKEILNTDGNILVVTGRQVGKSTIISIDAGEFAVKNPHKSVLVISHTERQAYLLFSKIYAYIFDNYKSSIKKGKDRPTKSEIKLINGSVIRCLPTGLDGAGIRGYTVDRLYPDEAAYIPEEVWTAVTPMLATTGGVIRACTTPRGKDGYVYEKMALNDKFKIFHISTEEVAKKRKDPQKTWMLEYLEQEKNRMTKLQYAQEYLGEFIGALGRLFPDELIKKCMTEERRGLISIGCYFLGIDVARMGGDESTFEILEKRGETIKHVENLVTTRAYLTETTDMILILEEKYKFNKIGIDDGGMGVGVFDSLLRHDSTKSKIIALNNARRNLTRDETRQKKLLKEDMYMNLVTMMEKGQINLLKDTDLFYSLKSVQFEHDDKGVMKIFGNYTHIAEGLIRAAWLANKKNLSIWCR